MARASPIASAPPGNGRLAELALELHLLETQGVQEALEDVHAQQHAQCDAEPLGGQERKRRHPTIRSLSDNRVYEEGGRLEVGSPQRELCALEPTCPQAICAVSSVLRRCLFGRFDTEIRVSQGQMERRPLATLGGAPPKEALARLKTQGGRAISRTQDGPEAHPTHPAARPAHASVLPRGAVELRVLEAPFSPRVYRDAEALCAAHRPRCETSFT